MCVCIWFYHILPNSCTHLQNGTWSLIHVTSNSPQSSRKSWWEAPTSSSHPPLWNMTVAPQPTSALIASLREDGSWKTAYFHHSVYFSGSIYFEVVEGRTRPEKPSPPVRAPAVHGFLPQADGANHPDPWPEWAQPIASWPDQLTGQLGWLFFWTQQVANNCFQKVLWWNYLY